MARRKVVSSIYQLALTLKDNDSDKNNEQTKYNDTSRTNGTFGFARHTSRHFAKPKEPFFLPTHNTNSGV
jgi:hypothetical protein